MILRRKHIDSQDTADSESGAVLLTTLLIMAIMAALAVALMDDVRLALKRTANVNDYAQADWYVRGAEDYVGDVLGASLLNIEAENRNQVLTSMNPLILPLEGGAMQLDIRDGSHCFNLNSLTSAENESVNTVAANQFIQLMEILGIPPIQSTVISARVIDWIDSDNQTQPGGAEDGDYLRRTPPILTANTGLASVMELRAIEGITAEIYETLRPWVCIGPPHEISPFNVDSAQPWQAPLLATYLGGQEQLALALQILQERPPQGYGDFATLSESPALAAFGDDKEDAIDSDLWAEDIIVFTPPALWVELSLAYRKVQRSRSFNFTGLDNNTLLLTYRGWGRESFRPNLDPNILEAASLGQTTNTEEN
ncbi:type II secretion system protein K (GspK) [Litorimonas taeanensis]|uniref:Type II secretion system protein K (GspK) n=1 Tax=Litorimonas taeanensis TaxID=568099 RepID=A0A420WE48_9PROT|nr:type II secretion system minor pseudopilin GspK [Litorimonas taeanensis]RKQ69215.1 type II secretion system protein K (GspK) [Litorimonas taeanensis]